MHQVIETLSKENLSTYFILPLLGLNKDRFGENNFLNCYLSKNQLFCYVKVKEPLPTFPAELIVVYEEKFYYKFLIPENWKQDVEYFCRGEYSQFSEAAKKIICTNSTLVYKALITSPHESIVSTDIRLLALTKDETVKVFWRNEIYATETESIITPEMELLSAPEEKDFIESEMSV